MVNETMAFMFKMKG